MMRVTVVTGGQTFIHNRVTKIVDYDFYYIYLQDLDSTQRVRYPLIGTQLSIETYREKQDAKKESSET